MEATMSQNMILIGFMGSGKTTVGKRLAQKKSRIFLDLDEQIATQQQQSIKNIFQQFGETYFRMLEQRWLEQFSMQQACILATGGGTLLTPVCCNLLQKIGRLIYLKADFETIWERLQNDGKESNMGRPLFQLGKKEQLYRLWQEREALYQAAAQEMIDTTEQTIEQVASLLAEYL